MERPRAFFAAVLRDPLSEVTRKERIYLLGTSMVGIAILKTGLVPTQITALGIEFQEADQDTFLLLLGLVVLYFLVAFIVYAASDFLAWWEGYRTVLYEILPPLKRSEMMAQMEEQRKHAMEQMGKSLDEIKRANAISEARWQEELELAKLRRTAWTGLVVATIRALLEYLLPVLLGAYAAYILIL